MTSFVSCFARALERLFNFRGCGAAIPLTTSARLAEVRSFSRGRGLKMTSLLKALQ